MTRAFARVACIPQTAGCPRRRQATGIPWLDYRLPKPPRRWGDHERHWYASASICGNNRVVFNVGGNKYRFVVEVQYQAGIVWVKFVGTHAQYDRIDVESVNDY